MTIDELRRLEQPELVKLIDEGKLMYPPCAVGDTVYGLGSYFGKRLICELGDIIPLHILEIHYSSTGLRYCIGCGLRNKCDYFCCDMQSNFSNNDFGKTVFLTLPEAEQALKEMEGNNG
jgi:hypothetical protein